MTKKQPIKLWKYSGIFLVVTGILHSVIGVILGKDYLWSIHENGLFSNTVGDDAFRAFAFSWFITWGIIVIILGHVLHFYTKREQKPAPFFVGFYFLGLSLIGCILLPVSDFWLFIPVALVILFAKRKKNEHRDIIDLY